MSGLCGVCGDPHQGFGWAPPGRDVMFACNQCLPQAPNVYGATKVDRTRYEELARDAAGAEAGTYLETLGKTDLARLTPMEWERFLEILFAARASKLRDLVSSSEAPF